MKKAILICLTILIAAVAVVSAQSSQSAASTEVIKIEARPEKGFSYPYYLYVPKILREASEQNREHSFLVIPNNSGKINDDLAFHEEDVKRKIPQIGAFLSSLKAPLLMPVFPRPATDHRIYTHSLDRDVMLTGKKEYSRFDLQLIAMIEDARARLAKEKIKTEKQILMQGYSASGMFVNRFVFLHPELVKAAVVGAPGGWAIAPIGEYRKKSLTFPVGTSDFREISGKSFDLKRVRKIPLLMILGGQDTNDAVPMGDAYDRRESELVIELFGATPIERWSKTETLYRENNLNAIFKLYPEATHAVTKEMREDMLAFLAKFAL